MAAMSTALTEFNDTLNSRTWTYTGHTTSKPKLVIQKRKVPSGNQVVSEDVVSVISGAEDSNGIILPSKIVFTFTCRQPIEAIAADVSAAFAVFRDVVAGDELGTTVTTQNYLK